MHSYRPVSKYMLIVMMLIRKLCNLMLKLYVTFFYIRIFPHSYFLFSFRKRGIEVVQVRYQLVSYCLIITVCYQWLMAQKMQTDLHTNDYQSNIETHCIGFISIQTLIFSLISFPVLYFILHVCFSTVCASGVYAPFWSWCILHTQTELSPGNRPQVTGLCFPVCTRLLQDNQQTLQQKSAVQQPQLLCLNTQLWFHVDATQWPRRHVNLFWFCVGF